MKTCFKIRFFFNVTDLRAKKHLIFPQHTTCSLYKNTYISKWHISDCFSYVTILKRCGNAQRISFEFFSFFLIRLFNFSVPNDVVVMLFLRYIYVKHSFRKAASCVHVCVVCVQRPRVVLLTRDGK